MPDAARLEASLQRIDGRSYPAYRDLRGRWKLDELELSIDHVQGDPFAAPSRVRLKIPTGIARHHCQDPDARIAAEDWLLRRFGDELMGTRRGSGRSGELRVYRPGPEVVERSAVVLGADGVAEVRFTVGLPARGRRISGRQAFELLVHDVPLAAQGLQNVGSMKKLHRHIESVCAQRALRRQLVDRGLVAFVANGAILPRASGIDQHPLADAVPFASPSSLRVELDTPTGSVEGMGVPVGLTVVVGGGFHGKSTLLQAVQRGHLDHVPGDGRERVVAVPDTVKVRAEDGRRVAEVDISAFLRGLPGGRKTQPFSTEDASGSTSQAAALMEAVEAGARLILLDEDTSATNLLVRDARMRELIPRDLEPITPFVDRVRSFHAEWEVSTMLVVGGVSDYLSVADTVISMEGWVPHDRTERAHQIAGRITESAVGPLSGPGQRIPQARSVRPTGKGRVRARDERRVDYGREEIDLTAVEQVLDGAHAASLGHALRLMADRLMGEERPIETLLNLLDEVFDAEGLDALSPYREPVGALVRPRRHEIAAALNRLRTLKVRYLSMPGQPVDL